MAPVRTDSAGADPDLFRLDRVNVWRRTALPFNSGRHLARLVGTHANSTAGLRGLAGNPDASADLAGHGGVNVPFDGVVGNQV